MTNEKQPRICRFSDCDNPVSPESQSGLCARHLSLSRWAADKINQAEIDAGWPPEQERKEP